MNPHTIDELRAIRRLYPDLFTSLDEEECVDLPALTRSELRALQDAHVIASASELQWWTALTDATRTELTTAAQQGLIARNLLTLDPDHPADLPVAEPVQLTLAARSAPTFVTLVGPARDPEPQILAYGIDDDALLVELRLVPGLAKFALTTWSYAASMIADYLLAPPDPAPSAAESTSRERVDGRRVETLGHTLQPASRHLVARSATAATLTPVDRQGTAGTEQPTSRQELIDAILADWSHTLDTALETA